MSNRRRRALYADLAAHELGELFADGQPQSGTAVFAHGRGVHLRERPEQAVHVVRRNPNPGIRDREAQNHIVLAFSIQRDANRHLPLLRELNRVVRQVQQYLLQARRVAANGAGTRASTAETRCRPFSAARSDRLSVTVSTTSGRSKSIVSNSSLPASILEKSSMLLIRASSILPEDLARDAYRRCFSSSWFRGAAPSCRSRR